MMLNMRWTLVTLTLILLLAAPGCGGADDEEGWQLLSFDDSYESEEEAAYAQAAAGEPDRPGAPAAPAATAMPAPAATAAPAAMMAQAAESADDEVAFVSQSRIIVWTVDMDLVVADPSADLNRVGDLAKEFGGWVVSSNDTEKHRALISIRVPATRLDEAIERLGRMAEKHSVVRHSEDVTDEYVDLSSRLTNMEATETTLLRMLDRAEKVEDALRIQLELSNVQQEVERLKGRIKFLEQTSAFSLINAVLRLAPVEMAVDAGEDQTLSLGTFARFRATFTPPEGTDSFWFTWDFGDGISESSVLTAPTTTEGTRVTATMTHYYEDDRDSPYIVSVKISATGEDASAEGEDSLIATVTRAPAIDVFAGESQVVEEGEEVQLSGSFTRPEGLTDLKYSWDFGDGTLPTTGAVGEGVTRTSATHVYPDHRPHPYTVTLTVSGQSEVGEVEASQSIDVLVDESPAWTISDWSPVDTGRTAVRTLSGIGAVAGSLLIFAAIFSPLWGAVLALSLFFYRRSQVSPPRPEPPSDDASKGEETPADGEEPPPAPSG